MKEEIKIISEKIIPLLKEKGVTKAGIFGSYARGEQTKDSDIDILVEIKGSLFDLANLELEIEKRLMKKIDLLSYKGISPYLKDKILSEEVRII